MIRGAADSEPVAVELRERLLRERLADITESMRRYPDGRNGRLDGPGGGIEPRELPLAALRRDMHEETGLVIDADPPQVWHQEVAAPGHADGYDGVVNAYCLVRTKGSNPPGALSDDDSAAEHISGMRWCRQEDIADYGGTTCPHPVTSPPRWRR